MEPQRAQAPTPLLTATGQLTRPSWATENVFSYNRQALRYPRRCKEWEFYQASNRHWLFQAVYGHVGYAGSVSVTFLDFETGRRIAAGPLLPFPRGRLALPFTGLDPYCLQYEGRELTLTLEHGGGVRRIQAHSRELDACLTCSDAGEAMVIATPFSKPGYFYFNCKKNFLTLSGAISAGGRTVEPDGDTFLLLDSGRGIWPYRQEWYWGSGTGRVCGGILGLNVGWGFGDTSAATEDMLFWNGDAVKLRGLRASLDPSDPMKPWRFVSDDGRLDAVLHPDFDNYTETNLLLVHNRCHQVHGTLTGWAMPRQERLPLDGTRFFCEHAVNRW